MGDLLLQVLFYAEMAKEQNSFSIDDVLDRLSTKLINRHKPTILIAQLGTNWMDRFLTDEQMSAYLDQLSVSARPASVDAAELALRHLAGRVTVADPACTAVAHIERAHIEDYKLWLASRWRSSRM